MIRVPACARVSRCVSRLELRSRLPHFTGTNKVGGSGRARRARHLARWRDEDAPGRRGDSDRGVHHPAFPSRHHRARQCGMLLGHEAFIRQYMSTLTAGFVSYIRSTIHQLQPASSFATWSCLYSAIQTRLDF